MKQIFRTATEGIKLGEKVIITPAGDKHFGRKPGVPAKPGDVGPGTSGGARMV